MIYFSDYSAKSKHYDDSNKLVVGNMKYKTGGIALKKSVAIFVLGR